MILNNYDQRRCDRRHRAVKLLLIAMELIIWVLLTPLRLMCVGGLVFDCYPPTSYVFC